MPVTFFLIFVPALGLSGYSFPSQGVRTSWLIAHISALLGAYAALGFSLLASVLYLLQERRLKSKLMTGAESRFAPLDWLPPLDTLERIAHAMLLFGFPCMTVGPGPRRRAGAGDLTRRRLLSSIPKSSLPLRCGGFMSFCSSSAAPLGCAARQGRLSLRRRAGGDARCLGRQPGQPRPQVRCPMSQHRSFSSAVNHKTAPIEAARAHRHLARGTARGNARTRRRRPA